MLSKKERFSLTKERQQDSLGELLSLGIFSYCNCGICTALFKDGARHPPVLSFKKSDVRIFISRNFRILDGYSGVTAYYAIGCPMVIVDNGLSHLKLDDILDYLHPDEQETVLFNINLFRDMEKTNEI